jgi:hypothetical protein
MIKQALDNLKINALNPMQEAAIAAAKKGDVILLSPTGLGQNIGLFIAVTGLAGCQYTNRTGNNTGTIARACFTD